MPSTLTYVAFVEPAPGREFCVRFPDFPGVRTGDWTIEDVELRGSQLLRAHIDRVLEADDTLPEPTSVERIKDDSRYRDGFLMRVDVEVPGTRLRPRGRRGRSCSRD